MTIENWLSALKLGKNRPGSQAVNLKRKLPDTLPLLDVFTVDCPDFRMSPYTGMTREHWKKAARYLLTGAFSYIRHPDDVMVFPKQHGKCYPHDASTLAVESLEGICRTLLLAAPLLNEDPDMEINGVRIAGYYRNQIRRMMNKKNPCHIRPRNPKDGPGQILVELGVLSIALFILPDILWEPLSKTEKKALSRLMLSYGNGPTIDTNWKFFNIFILSFLKKQGYRIDECRLKELLERTLNHYRGQGWYHDNPAYDYYSMWGFQLYGILWSLVIGNDDYPEISARFKSNFNALTGTYPHLFSREGQMIIWGRSICYRMAAAAPLPFAGLIDDPQINCGWMRRIASGVILQFLQHPDFLEDNIPTLGVYGTFEPAVQIYSCRGSVYWMGKVFLGLLLPPGNRFWTATENNGAWDTASSPHEVHSTFLEGSKLLITNYPSIGASEVRAWCHERKQEDWQQFRSTENYNRLAYNSAFPWQADGPNGEVAMNYLVKTKRGEWEPLRLYTFQKFENEAYFRDAVLETNERIRFRLVDIPIPNGILRIDKNMSAEPFSFRLGHYALPEFEKSIETRQQTLNDRDIRIIDNGVYQLSLVPVRGWRDPEVIVTRGLHPESDTSSLLLVTADALPETGNRVYAVLMLWSLSGTRWTEKELFPLTEFMVSDDQSRVRIQLGNGPSRTLTLS